MSIVDRVIDVFEKRVSALEKIRYLPDLPQWTDADVIEASCLIEQYRNLTSQFSGQDEAWFCSCLLYTSPSPRDRTRSRMPSSA